MRICSFDVWRERMLDDWRRCIQSGIDGECPECNGSGSVSGECCECRQEIDVDCKLCQATGSITGIDLDSSRFFNLFTESAYRDAVAHDIKDLFYFTGKIDAEAAWSAGLFPFTPILPGVNINNALAFSHRGNEFGRYPTGASIQLRPPVVIERAA